MSVHFDRFLLGESVKLFSVYTVVVY